MALFVACNNPERPDPHAQAGEGEQAPPKAEAPPVASAPANGWGEDIAWRGYDEAFAQAKAEGKPLMLVVYTSWCSKCRALKPTFHSSEFADLSRDFVMVNADQEQVPGAMSQAPDGEYIPRILFFSPDGELHADVQNGHNPRYRYYYSPQDDLMGRMRQVLERHGRNG